MMMLWSVFFCLLIAHVSSRSSVHLRNNVVENLLELILSWTLTVDVCVCVCCVTGKYSSVAAPRQLLRGWFVYWKHRYKWKPGARWQVMELHMCCNQMLLGSLGGWGLQSRDQMGIWTQTGNYVYPNCLLICKTMFFKSLTYTNQHNIKNTNSWRLLQTR